MSKLVVSLVLIAGVYVTAYAEEAVESAATAIALPETVDSLKIDTIAEGDGEAIGAGSTAVVHYTGWLYDPKQPEGKGDKFDSSRDRGDSFRFPLGGGRVIKGWDQGVKGMQVGEKRRLTIPPDLAYGDRGAGNVIPPGAILVFDVELMAIE